jgi:hypothetical protein
MSEYQKVTDGALHILGELEAAIQKSTGGHAELRKRADDAYDARVAQIAKERGVDLAEAHALAVTDEVASRAYAVSQELAERQAGAAEAASGAAAYIE